MEKTKITQSLARIIHRFAPVMAWGLLVLMVVSVFTTHPASAAPDSCSPTGTTYGTDTMTVNVPSSGTYTIWTRMQIPDQTNNAVLLSVDSTNCYNVVGNTSQTGSWQWVSTYDNNASNAVSLSLSAGNHTLVYTGTFANVEIDRVLAVTTGSCTPTGVGDNCTQVADTTPPTTPSGVTASAQSTTSIRVSWSASTDTGGSGLAGYYVNKYDANGNAIGSPIAIASSATQYTDSGLAPNTTYKYTVQAYDGSANVSLASTQVSATTQAVVPSTPTNVSANATAYNSVTVTWTASTDTNGPGLAGYYIYRATGGGSAAQVGSVGTSPQSFTDTTVSASTTYAYTVKAYDTIGTTSAASTGANATTPAAPSQIPTVSIPAFGTGGNSKLFGKTASLSATVTPASGRTISQVQLLVNNVVVKTDTTSPYTFSLDTTPYHDGHNTLTITATDNQGGSNSTSSTAIFTNGDYNNDSYVNIQDLSSIVPYWLHSGTTYAQGDINGDGFTNIQDLSVILKDWQKTWQ